MLNDLVCGHPTGDPHFSWSTKRWREDGGLQRRQRANETETHQVNNWRRSKPKPRCGVSGAYFIVVEVSVNGKAVLSFCLSLCCRLSLSPPPLHQGCIAHTAEQVGLHLQLLVLMSRRTQSGTLIRNRAFGSQTSI